MFEGFNFSSDSEKIITIRNEPRRVLMNQNVIIFNELYSLNISIYMRVNFFYVKKNIKDKFIEP